MSRQYVIDSDSLASALAARLDKFERDFTETRTDVQALGRGMADVMAAVRAGGNGAGPAPADQDEDAEEPETQPDWFAPDLSAEQARTLVSEVIEQTGTVLAYYGIELAPACWPLHPTVVADLLALIHERKAAYADPRPTPVSEWLGRWEPGTTSRLTEALSPCRQERAHFDRLTSRSWVTDLDLDPLSVATWWATDRTTPAETAFGFTPA